MIKETRNTKQEKQNKIKPNKSKPNQMKRNKANKTNNSTVFVAVRELKEFGIVKKKQFKQKNLNKTIQIRTKSNLTAFVAVG